MPFSQRDIVKVKAKMPDGSEETHPFLIISCEYANGYEAERCYCGVMITHSQTKNRFTIPLISEMMETYWNEPFAQVRMHLITKFMESDISRDVTHYVGRMKKVDFVNVIDQIKSFIFSVDK